MIRNIFTVLKKEFLQLMRDKSILFTNFFIPFFGLPLYILIVFELTSYVVHKKVAPLTDDTVFKISYQGDIPVLLEKNLGTDKKIKIVQSESKLREQDVVNYRLSFKNYLENKKKTIPFKKRLQTDKKELTDRNRESRKVAGQLAANKLIVESKFDSSKSNAHIAFFDIKDGGVVSYIFYSDKSPVSSTAKDYIKKMISGYESTLRKKTMQIKGISKADLDPVTIWDVNLNEQNGRIMQIAGIAIGGWLLFMLIIGIFNPSVNTTLGERDGQTYKVLLMNPIGMTEIFLGKYLNIALQGLMTLIPYFIQAFIFYIFATSNLIIPSVPLFTPLNILFFIISTICVAICISAFCFLLSSFAKSRQQAQSVMSLAILCIMIPIGAIGMAQLDFSFLIAFLPIINFPMMIENLMTPAPHYVALVAANIVNILFSVFLIWLSLNAFEVQWKGKNDTRSVSDLISFRRRPVKDLIPAHAFLAFCIAALGYLYGGVVIQIFKVQFFQFVLAPLLFSLGTAVLIIYNSKLDFTKVIRWESLFHRFTPLVIIVAIVSAVAIQFTFKFLIPLEWMSANFPVLFADKNLTSMIASLLIFSFIPGFCEEVLFRGVIFQGLRKQYNFLISSVMSSLFFAVIHFSLFRWGHTFLIGIMLAYIYEKRGIMSAITFHIIFNMTIVIISFI